MRRPIFWLLPACALTFGLFVFSLGGRVPTIAQSVTEIAQAATNPPPTFDPSIFTPVPTVDPFSLQLPATRPISVATSTVPPSLAGVTGYTGSAAVAIRSGPGLEYPRVGALGPNRAIDIVGYNGYNLNRSCSPNFQADLDMWVQVRILRVSGDVSGWMARCALRIVGEFNLRNMLNNAPPPGSRPPRDYTPPAPGA